MKKIAVLVKQVPATENVKIDPDTGVMRREGLAMEVNPPDLHAIEEAVRLKEKFPAIHATAVTMGPQDAAKAARYAIAMGLDAGVLVTDKAFAGSDTLATSRVLSEALRRTGPFDLILAGERSTDGETGQVGPSVGALLGLPVLTYVASLEAAQDGKITARRAVEGGHETVSCPLPAVAVVGKEINVPRLCTLSGKLKGKNAEISAVGAADLGFSRETAGLAGSPTRVVNVGYPQVTRKGRKIWAGADFQGAVKELSLFASELKTEGF